MSADEQRQSAERGYAAFREGDADAALSEIDDSVEWIVGGESSVSGTYKGKHEVLRLWGKLMEVGFSTEPSQFLADGDKVVVLSTIGLAGETRDVADLLTYGESGKLIRFQSFGGEGLVNQRFPK